MEAKDKAKELVDKYLDNKCFDGRYGEDYNYIYCALIAVDEILKAIVEQGDSAFYLDNVKYWQEVKQEINKLNYAS
jgi:hypothetical protein